MKIIFGALTVLLLSSCGVNTGLGPIDDVTEPYKQCEFTFTVTNNSTHAINIHIQAMEVADLGHCQGGDDQTNSLPAGQTAAVKADLTCRTCMVHDMYDVSSTNPNVTYSHDASFEDQTSAAATCTDSGCSGN